MSIVPIDTGLLESGVKYSEYHVGDFAPREGDVMRRHRTVAAFLIVMLTSAVHAFAQSSAGSPRIAPAPRTGVRQLPPRVLGFGDNGESGTYTYDGSGNIIAIGSDTFLYDAEGRLVSAFVRGAQANYTYDAFGNRKTATGETNCLGQSVCATPLTVDSGTNRLLTTTANGATTSVGYGPAGNITAATGGLYTYDGTGMMTEATVGSDDRQFVYTADDERIAVRQGVSWTWTVRGLDKKVLREFTSVEAGSGPSSMSNRQWLKDYVWRDGLLLASIDTTGTYHYHLDHLGTPRLITNMTRVKIAEHAYYPFGAEISLTPHESIEEAMKFTGHERDILAGDGHTLDDMHARYYNASLGRFLELDPVLGDPHNPQSLNRFPYVQNSPLIFTDPAGLSVAQAILPATALDQIWIGVTDLLKDTRYFAVVWKDAAGLRHEGIYLVNTDTGKVLNVWEHNIGWSKPNEAVAWKNSFAYDRGWTPAAAKDLGPLSVLGFAPRVGIADPLSNDFKNRLLQCSDYSTFLQHTWFVGYVRLFGVAAGTTSLEDHRAGLAGYLPPGEVLPKGFPR